MHHSFRALIVAMLGAVLLLWSTPATAQELTETLEEVGEAYARAYVDPLAESLGADLNTGLFHTASTGKKILGVNVYIGFKVSASLLDNSHKTFDLTYTGRVPIEFDLGGERFMLDVPATFTVNDAPTIFGSTEEAIAQVSVSHDTTLQTIGLTLPVSIDSTLAPEQIIGGLVDTDVAPFIVPQVGVGTFMGTDVMFRWLPTISVTDVGSIGIIGFGVRHNINQYIPRLPLDLAIQAVWQRVTVDDNLDNQVISAKVFAVNVAASKRFGVLTLYAGAQTERSDIRFSYTFEPDDFNLDEEPVDIDFTLSDIGKSRFVFGAGVKLGPVLFNTDISVGQITVASAGFGFSF